MSPLGRTLARMARILSAEEQAEADRYHERLWRTQEIRELGRATTWPTIKRYAEEQGRTFR